MLLALGDHLHALVVEDDHLHGVGGQQLDLQHVNDHDLVNSVKKYALEAIIKLLFIFPYIMINVSYHARIVLTENLLHV